MLLSTASFSDESPDQWPDGFSWIYNKGDSFFVSNTAITQIFIAESEQGTDLRPVVLGGYTPRRRFSSLFFFHPRLSIDLVSSGSNYELIAIDAGIFIPTQSLSGDLAYSNAVTTPMICFTCDLQCFFPQRRLMSLVRTPFDVLCSQNIPIRGNYA